MWKDKKQDEGFLKTRLGEIQSLFKEEEKGVFPFVKVGEESWVEKLNNKDFGPAGAVGVGCGAGIGVGLIGGIGVGATTWNHLKFVIGFGAGCGVGIGYGYGQGFGYLWDRRPPQKPHGKRIVIEI